MKYSKEIANKICKYVEDGVPRKDAAGAVGIAEATFYAWVDSKPEFSESIKKADGKATARNVLAIKKAAKKTWTAAAWWLERRRRADFAIRQELTGAEGEKLEIVVKDYEEKPTKRGKTHKKAKAVPKGDR